MADSSLCHATAETLPVENLEALLSQSLGECPKIREVKWRHLTDPGENFGSLILAVDATVIRDDRSEILNLVVKLPPRSAYLLDLFNSPLTFRKELHFYRDIVPAFAEAQREYGVPEGSVSSLAPRFFGGRLGLREPGAFDEQAAIVLENLKRSGYAVQDRIVGLDRAHVEFAVRELAKLHALAIRLRVGRPRFFEDAVLPALAPPANDAAERCLLDMVHKVRDDLRGMDEAKPYMDRVERTLRHCRERDDLHKADAWSTLVHNDFWVNNVMFRYDRDGNVDGIKIVDFQLCVHDYGMKDLVFFLVSSSRREVLDDHLDEMIELYYESFVRCLESLKVSAGQYTRERFAELLDQCATLKFEQCLMMAQVIQAFRGGTPEMNKIEGSNAFCGTAGNHIYRAKLLHILSTFDRKGWLLE